VSFGGQTITFVDRDQDKTGEPDELGHYPLKNTGVDAPGCRHRPMTFKEAMELGYEVGTEVWKSTIPIGEYFSDATKAAAYAAVVGAKAADVIVVDGVTYQIDVGVRPHPDMAGIPFTATLISKLQVS
jgi:hypothetical protein